MSLEPDDRIVLCTDGILETMNPSQEQFGTSHFMRFMEDNHTLRAESFTDALIAELSHCSEQPHGEGQQDDITLLVIDFKSRE